MIDEKKYPQYGYKRTETIEGITLHTTGSQASARELFNYLNEENKTSQGCHYLVDDKEVIEVMPLDWCVYHTGKGFDSGNNLTIAIEICSNIDEDKFKLATEKGVDLIITLMKKYGIKQDGFFFHNDFNNTTYCPAEFMEKYGSSRMFYLKEIIERI